MVAVCNQISRLDGIALQRSFGSVVTRWEEETAPRGLRRRLPLRLTGDDAFVWAFAGLLSWASKPTSHACLLQFHAPITRTQVHLRPHRVRPKSLHVAPHTATFLSLSLSLSTRRNLLLEASPSLSLPPPDLSPPRTLNFFKKII